MNTLARCIVCNGTGNQVCIISSYFSENDEEEQLEVPCLHCNGSGRVAQRVNEEVRQSHKIWCRCPDEIRNSYYVPDTADMKHHWRCNHCKKITQIG